MSLGARSSCIPAVNPAPLSAAPAGLAARWRIFLAGGGLVLAALLAWHNSFSAPFILDDDENILLNPSIRNLSAVGSVLVPPSYLGVGGRPVANLSLALDHALGGTDVRGYHATNLAIHVAAALLLFGLVRRTLLRPVLQERFGAASVPLAFVAALIWMVHPLQTESVTYIIQRTESLMGMFYLATLYCVVRGAESPRPDRWHILSVAACALGMATKEVMVTAPVVIWLYDRTFLAGTFIGALRMRWKLYAGLAATWLVLALLLMGAMDPGRAIGYEHGVTWWNYALTESRVVIHYLWLSLWPYPLILDRGMDIVQHPAEVGPFLVAIALLVGGTAYALWRRPVLGFAGAWVLVILSPASSVVPVAFQPMAEHRMYLPLASVVVAGVLALYDRIGRRSFPVLLVLAVLFGLLTVRRNVDYHSVIGMWTDNVKKCPDNARVRNTLGVMLAGANRLPEAIVQWREAVRVAPNYVMPYNNIGQYLAASGRQAEAVQAYQTALRLMPDFPTARANLGFSLLALGQRNEAQRQFEAVLRKDPDSVLAHRGMAQLYGAKGRMDEVVKHLTLALRISPTDFETQNNLGVALVTLGRGKEALPHFAEATRLKPDYAAAYGNLGLALVGQERISEARVQLQKAVRLEPGNPEWGAMLEKISAP